MILPIFVNICLRNYFFFCQNNIILYQRLQIQQPSSKLIKKYRNFTTYNSCVDKNINIKQFLSVLFQNKPITFKTHNLN